MDMINIKQASGSSRDLRPTVRTWPLRGVCLALFLAIVLSLPALAAPNEPPFDLPPKNALSHIRSALIKTSRGDIVLELFPTAAPWHVANFKYLADRRFYDGLSVTHAIEDHLIEAGDPRAQQRRALNYTLPAEFSTHKNRRGALGMASQADRSNPERASHPSIFHILMVDNPRMDGLYTVFGEVTDGMEVIDSLRVGDKIDSITVFVRP